MILANEMTVGVSTNGQYKFTILGTLVHNAAISNTCEITIDTYDGCYFTKIEYEEPVFENN